MQNTKLLCLGLLIFGMSLMLLPQVCLADAPSYPGDADVTAATAKSLTLTWEEATLYDDDPEILQYNIEVSTTDTYANPKTKSVDADVLTTTIKGLKSNRTYYVRVQGENADGEGRWRTTTDSTAPSKVKNLRKKKQSYEDRWVKLKWNRPLRCSGTSCEYTYKVFKRKNKDLVETDQTFQNNETISSLTQGGKYYFKVQACNNRYDRCGKWSKKKNFKLKKK